MLLLALLSSVIVAAPRQKRAAAPKRAADRLLLEARGDLSMVWVEKWLKNVTAEAAMNCGGRRSKAIDAIVVGVMLDWRDLQTLATYRTY